MSEITVAELKNLRDKLKADIHNLVSSRVEDFKLKTGVQIDYISISMIGLETVGLPPERIVGTVTVDLDI